MPGLIFFKVKTSPKKGTTSSKLKLTITTPFAAILPLTSILNIWQGFYPNWTHPSSISISFNLAIAVLASFTIVSKDGLLSIQKYIINTRFNFQD